MSDKEKHIPTYSSSDIEKYLSGELSAAEMHALERAALDDPFLADAIEGMAAHRQLPGPPSFREDMTQLQQRLQDRVAVKKKTRVLPLFMRYAAVLILLAGIGFTVFYMGSEKHKDLMAVHPSPKPVEAPPPAAAQVPAPSAQEEAVADSAPVKPDTITSSYSLAEKKDEEVYKKTDRKAAGKPAKKQDAYPLVDGSDIKPDDKQYAFQNAVAPRPLSADSLQLHFDTNALLRNADQARLFAATTATPQLFSGRVLDFKNNPVPNAYLAVRNNQAFNARTDKDGNFNLRVPGNQDTAADVIVSSVGYQEGYLTLSNANRVGNIIQLQPQSSSLNEVVVAGYGTKRREYLRKDIDAPQKALSQVAVPANGWPLYYQYLEANKRSVSLDSTLRGNESISFVVDRSGALSSFKVEQSISPAHDALLTRLIKQGPAWRLLSGKKARARVILTY